eukprot:TRINITY_DN6875_c0_g1_i1.p1 TRINITY_DN6875_c0_g1~~TRINITY_DN6875_c0_g1_i1.p1  ORF type:complete len:427 (-),score=103.60 TRINITY_DN6875_c0_g1_i1:110-1390(-)
MRIQKIVKDISVYFHYPYCSSICGYCDFNRYLHPNKIPGIEFNENHYLEAVNKQFMIEYNDLKEKWKDFDVKFNLKSIFIGGGTPSLAKTKTIDSLVSNIKKNFNIKDNNNIEITMECNPTSIEIEKLQKLQNVINRISIGIQSFKSDDLKFLGRTHSSNEAINAIEVANSLFEKVNFDLIYGRHVNQTVRDWEEELKYALSFSSGHMSLYNLTIEKNTDFYKRVHNASSNRKIILPSSDTLYDMYNRTIDVMNDHGYTQYEVSNFASSVENESVHNLNYWNFGDYIGLGAGASSRVTYPNNQRLERVQIKEPNKYISSLLPEFSHYLPQRKSKIDDKKIENILTKEESVEELLLLGLRTKYGVSLDLLGEYIDDKEPLRIFNQDVINQLFDEKYITIDDKTIQMTRKGMVLLDSVLLYLLNDMKL